MRKSKKSVFSLLLASSMVVGALGGCSASSDTDETLSSTAPQGGEDQTQPDATGEEPGSDREDETNKAPTDDASEPKEFTDLNNKEIVKAMGAGWNLGNQMEAVGSGGWPGETNWGNPIITEELILAVKEQGFNSIRIPISYLHYIGEGPDYTIDAEWLDRIQQVVDYCVDNDMYTIINMHGDGYTSVAGAWLFCMDENQDEICAKYEAVWGQIADRFKNYDEHLIFESMNEEFDGVTYSGNPPANGYENINRYNQIFVDTVRQAGGNNDRRWLLIPGWNTDIDYTCDDYGFKIPTDTYKAQDLQDNVQERIMISVHYYSPWDFCGGESPDVTQWGEDATDSTKVSATANEAYLTAQFKKLYQTFTRKGFPVVIGEYGSIDKSEFDENSVYYRAYFARRVCEASVEYGCIPMYWDNGHNGRYGFAIFNRSTKEVTQQEVIDAIMGVYNPVYDGTATEITLDQENLKLVIGSEGTALTATVDSDDEIIWKSSDPEVATVNSQGLVKPQTEGTCTVTATAASGISASCEVEVVASENVQVALYLTDQSSWSTINSNTVDISKDGGTYTVKLEASKNAMENMVTIYLKDIRLQSGVASETQFSSVKVTIDSFKLNGVDCTIVDEYDAETITGSKQLDYTIVNKWNVGGCKLVEAIGVDADGNEKTSGEPDHYAFKGFEYQDVNTIEMTFTVTDVTE